MMLKRKKSKAKKAHNLAWMKKLNESISKSAKDEIY